MSLCLYRLYSAWHEGCGCHGDRQWEPRIKVIIRSQQGIMLVWPTKRWQEEGHQREELSHCPAIRHTLQDDVNSLPAQLVKKATIVSLCHHHLKRLLSYNYSWPAGVILPLLKYNHLVRLILYTVNCTKLPTQPRLNVQLMFRGYEILICSKLSQEKKL